MMDKLSHRILVVIAILLITFSRLIPHPPNFTPLLAVSIFAGIKLRGEFFSYFIPIISMFLSDLFIGFHQGLNVIYPMLLFTVFFARSYNNIH